MYMEKQRRDAPLPQMQAPVAPKPKGVTRYAAPQGWGKGTHISAPCGHVLRE